MKWPTVSNSRSSGTKMESFPSSLFDGILLMWRAITVLSAQMAGSSNVSLHSRHNITETVNFCKKVQNILKHLRKDTISMLMGTLNTIMGWIHFHLKLNSLLYFSMAQWLIFYRLVHVDNLFFHMAFHVDSCRILEKLVVCPKWVPVLFRY